ncbi:serine O-acetyltransferase [Nitritalea halalkaliphila LW7]|uniref:Serine acetyltransferase n=1 Tax=Nitritalea halalkaliphila LW7 TaxID=1189621 RepID=I5CA27_9BACT|nr:serine O-acetyltransferase [Nitritalea halalkaliphila]EIM78679.1 serine O-acetyltransferase [Nitritalea halalkaliphila LW7]
MSDFTRKLFKAHQACPDCPSPQAVHQYFEQLMALLFPEYTLEILRSETAVQAGLLRLEYELEQLLLRNKHLVSTPASEVVATFFSQLEEIYDAIQQDIDAMYAGDPAAKSRTEILRSYPGFYAIAAYRVAHALHHLGVRMIPRMLTEIAHSKTGIDIHPGAEIGAHFCIDHGTGIVIGETTKIGAHVKIYQGVTLGALSVDKADADKKRHPTIEEGVVIYAGATILGGKTVIGANSIIGGNVWLTKSVPAGSKIYYQSKMYDASGDVSDVYVLKT